MYINKVNTSAQYARIDKKGKDGNGALTAEVYALEIDVHGWRVRNRRCMAEDELVDQFTDLLCSVYNFCFEVLHTRCRG
jgi:hypothetical protein